MTASLWHVYFDDDPVLVGHICGLHRAMGQALACPDQNADGDCDHVHTRPCQCQTQFLCAACFDTSEVVDVEA